VVDENGDVLAVYRVVQVGSEGRVRLKHDGKRAETRFGLSAKRTSQFKLAGGGGGG